MNVRNTDSVVHEENSSSPNANLTITEIKTGAAGESVRIRLSDSSSFFIPPEALFDLKLSRDLQVGPELLEKLRHKAELFSAKQKALELSARRDHAGAEMEIKLRQRGYSDAVIQEVIQLLLRLEIIDDRRFAETWLHTRMRRRPDGPLKLKAALLRKGVDGGIVEQVLQESFDAAALQSAIDAAAEKVLPKCGGDEQKFIRMLKNRGYSWKHIKTYSLRKFSNYYNKLH